MDFISFAESRNLSSYHMFNTKPDILRLNSLKNIFSFNVSATAGIVEFVTNMISVSLGIPSKTFELIPAGRSIRKVSPYWDTSLIILFQEM